MKFNTLRKVKRLQRFAQRILVSIAKTVYRYSYKFYELCDPWEGEKKTTVRIKIKR
ncbi:MAG: hypothetical protein R3321_15600 [Nitrososphaeraceae archaeon]|nr:hypothetical protein [Nitrososphaeraceae archaeon]